MADSTVVASPRSHTLSEKLAEALPQGLKLSVHHLSSPPTRCDPIYSAPPGAEPDRTQCESRFLAVSTSQASHEGSEKGEEVLVYAIEVLIYTTKKLTTLFVSKADSTGYLASSNLSSTTSSPLKTISSVFVSHLVGTHQRPGVKLVVSLFARAQDQYLFPGSVENDRKHVLDDRRLIRWWCRVLDPVVRPDVLRSSSASSTSAGGPALGYLLVPGFDKYEIQALLPPTARSGPVADRRWIHGNPLREISQFRPPVPPRCLIPHFPDDPKARFMDELDEELSEPTNPKRNAGSSQNSPSKRARTSGTGQWRSVKSLEHFWEAMEFRQECSSGRAVGFIWIVFPPSTLAPQYGKGETKTGESSEVPLDSHSSLPTPESSQDLCSSNRSTRLPHDTSSRRRRRRSPRLPLSGPILPLAVHRQQFHAKSHRSSSSSRSSTNGLVVPQATYTRAHDLLLRVDFSTERAAIASTNRWVTEVGGAVSISSLSQRRATGWGEVVTGRDRPSSGEGRSGSSTVLAPNQSTTQVDGSRSAQGSVNVLSTSMMRKKKRKPDEGGDGDEPSNPASAQADNHDLTGRMAEAAPRVGGTRPEPQAEQGNTADNVSVNVLGAGLVRKKQKKAG